MFDLNEFVENAQELNNLENAIVNLEASDVKVPKVLRKAAYKKYDKAFKQMGDALNAGISREDLAQEILNVINNG